MMGFKLLKKLLTPAVIMASVFILNFNFGVVKAFPLQRTDFKLTVQAIGKAYEFCYPEIDFLGGELYLKNAEEVVDGIYFDTLVKPKDAVAKIFTDRENPFEFTKESYGKAIDKEDLLLKIDKALKNKTEKITAKEIVLKPEYTIQKLKQSTYRLAFFKTNYCYSTQERKHNIALATSLIGGVTLYPHEEFSFNERVGERTEEKGFKNAKIIEKGKFTDGVGGGVCQVSSTLYNVALLSGLEITERHAHSMMVSYVEPSFDAMVSLGYADLKFVNNTGGVVFIIAKTNSDNVEISIYGQKNAYEYKRVSVVKEKVSPPEIERVESDALMEGEEKISVYPKYGAISEGYLEIYKNGKLIETKKLSLDKYAPLQGELLYGKSRSIS